LNPQTPNQLSSADITYIVTDEGWVYLAAVIDRFSPPVVGWSMKDHMQISLVKDAWEYFRFLLQRYPKPMQLKSSY
jgi:putative transposase